METEGFPGIGLELLMGAFHIKSANYVSPITLFALFL